jgi:hypothetical protein
MKRAPSHTSPHASPKGSPAVNAREADADSVLLALEATGASSGEALGLACKGFGPDRVRAKLEAALCHGEEEGGFLEAADAVRLLNDVAEHAPDLALWGLGRWAQGRCVDGDLDLSRATWVRALPDGLEVDGELRLVDCLNLERLPKGMIVHGNLMLFGCKALKKLPDELDVVGDLMLDDQCGLARLSDQKIRAVARIQEAILRY